jgi:molybdopterin biosynthesis enzyme
MSRDATPAALTPLARLRDDILRFAAAVTPRSVPSTEAIGAVAAEDLVAATAVPEMAVALIAGHAVASIETVGASPYAPAIPSRLVPVAAGAALPAGCDAVVPDDAVGHDFGPASVQQAVAPGESVRRAGEDFAAGTRLVAAGERIAPHLALLAAAIGQEHLPIRSPRLTVRHGDAPEASRTARLIAAMVGRDAETKVGPLDDETDTADLVLLVGDAEIGPTDAALAVLDRTGRRLGHGAALTGLESLAWGTIADRPALVLPHRPEAIFAAHLTLIEPLLATLAGSTEPPPTETRPLSRKIVSQVGMSEIALLARDGSSWRPLATGGLPWSAIAAADAFVELPPESEGFAEGTPLVARLLTCSPHRSTS